MKRIWILVSLLAVMVWTVGPALAQSETAPVQTSPPSQTPASPEPQAADTRCDFPPHPGRDATARAPLSFHPGADEPRAGDAIPAPYPCETGTASEQNSVQACEWP